MIAMNALNKKFGLELASGAFGQMDEIKKKYGLR
jgi:hypothetical protein